MTEAPVFLRTPHGLRHRLRVHHVGGGARIQRGAQGWRNLSDGSAAPERPYAPASTPTAAVATTGGWISYATWTNSAGTPISLFQTSWIVPPPPTTNSGQTIFLFNSIMDAPQHHILQPVLSWGPSASPGSSASWSAASWWVGQTTDPCFISDLVPVNSGDVLQGQIAMFAQGGGLFSYTCEFLGIAATKLTAESLPELTVCTETLEAYAITANSDYPGTSKTPFTGINLRTAAGPAPLAWTPLGVPLPVIVNPTALNGEVDIAYP